MSVPHKKRKTPTSDLVSQEGRPLNHVAAKLNLPPETTLVQARQMVSEGIKKGAGVICPCCEQQATVYYRRINKSICRVLWALARHHQENGNTYAHVPTLFSSFKSGLANSKASQGGQWAQAEKWGLIEREKGQKREDGSLRTGHARITAKGLAFLAGKYRIREYALFYANTLLGKAGDPMGIDAVRDFDYKDIFSGSQFDAREFNDEELYVNKSHFVDVTFLVHAE